MAGRESRLWQHVRTALCRAARRSQFPLYLTRVENPLNTGHPDVEYCYRGAAGVVELKARHAWPKRSGTPVRLRHYTAEQRDELKARHAAGGRAFVLLQVADEYLLIPIPQALLIGQTTREELYRISAQRWVGKIDGDGLLAALSER